MALIGGKQVFAQPTNDNFADAIELFGGWGTVTNENVDATGEFSEPSHAGYKAQSSIWYKWTAPSDGEVTLDTFGSDFLSDSVLAVYVGSELSSLTQIAANDDLFPLAASPQLNRISSGDYASYVGPGGLASFSYTQRYSSLSGLRFNAKAGTTYYFAVDTKLSSGKVALNWAYKSAGVFRFATEDKDYWTRLPVYQCASTESRPPFGTALDANSVKLTYYKYNAPGVLVTVTRVGGAVGRAMVNYRTLDGSELPISLTNNLPAVSNIDYVPVSGTLIFDDFEMSKTILIPILSAASGGSYSNTVFGILLSDPQPDPLESADVSVPRIDPAYNLALIKILNAEADPYGPSMAEVVDPDTMATNLVIVPPTNSIFNFQKVNYRVPADVNGTNESAWPEVALYVSRSGTNRAAVTLHYRVNNLLGNDRDANEEQNILFPLQPGSDYAVPTPAEWLPVRGTNSDFSLAAGTIAWGDNDFDPKKITFSVPTSKLTKFNKDFRVQLYRTVSINNRDTPVLVGMINEATVTILFEDQNPPAGSVDQLHNADFNGSLALSPELVPQTWPDNNLANPGVSGQVYGMVVWPDEDPAKEDHAVIVGDFFSYNGYSQNSIAKVNSDGSPDISFDTGTGANGAINTIARAPGGSLVIGGVFTAFNGNGSSGIARINGDGSVDSAFTPNVNGPVRAVLVQADGKVVIGGDFTLVNGEDRKYLARLNPNGSLDTSFAPGNILNGPVYCLASPDPELTKKRRVSGTTAEVVTTMDFSRNVGALYLAFDSLLSVSNSVRVFYGNTNGTPIYESANVLPSSSITVPFGPTGGLDTNVLVIVMNQGGGNADAFWGYRASVSVPNAAAQGILVGGEFEVAGHPYRNIARLDSVTGALDPSFNPGTGTDDRVLSIGWEVSGQIVAGGVFTHVNGIPYNHIVRFNADGSIDTSNFFVGSGADNVVYSVNSQQEGIYVGGAFSSFNGTHRLGFVRLYKNGTVDTSFMDTAYNQFAGLKRIYSWEIPAVFVSAVQSDGNILIGGSFNQVGGGQANTNSCNVLDDEFGYFRSFDDPNLWVEPKSRDGVRNRSSFARLIGGRTPGPGNIGLKLDAYSANKSQSLLSVSLIRTNGHLGPASANFSVEPGLALSGRDYVYNSAAPMFWIAWNYLSHPSRVRSDGLFGTSGFLMDPYGLNLGSADSVINNQSVVTVSVVKNSQTAGNLNARFRMANPSYADNFFLGGQNIPVGAALGVSSAPLTLVDDTQQPGVFGFSSPVFIATNASASISVLRSNGIFGAVSMKYSTSDGTAIAGIDFNPLPGSTMVFNQNVVSNGFTVTVRNSGNIYTNMEEKTVNLRLSNLGTTPGAKFGISNAVLRLINPNYQGYITLGATNYSSIQSLGSLTFVVNRVAGSLGTLTVQYATVDGSAHHGVDYLGQTNTLTWNSGDVAPKVITVSLIQNDIVGTNRQFFITLSSPTLNGAITPALMGAIPNATATIANDNSYGSIQLAASSYVVNEAAGYITITAVRTGGVTGSASVNFSTSDGAGTVAGVNYTATAGVLNFTNNQISASINVPILNDEVVNSTEAFNFGISLSNPVNATLGQTTNALVSIIDADSFVRPPGGVDTGFDLLTAMNGSVFSLAQQSDGKLLAGGNFTAVGPTTRNRIARLNNDGGLDTTFLNGLQGINDSVLSIVSQTDDRILVGGAFTGLNGVQRNFIARLMTDGSLDTSFNPGSGADNTVMAIAETFVDGARKVYVGGAFASINSFSCPGLARLNNDGSSDPSFAIGTGTDGAVTCLAVYPTNSIYSGKLLAGGSFTHYRGNVVNRLARLNPDGTLDVEFNTGAGFNGTVSAIAIQPDGRILVGGSFTDMNGHNVGRLARLNSDGSIDTTFTANFGSGFNDDVNAIALQADNRILVVGQFTQQSGVTRNHITRLLPGGSIDPSINFGAGANGDINAVLVQAADGMIVIGGGFSEYDQKAYGNIARIYGSSETGSGAFSFSAPTYRANELGSFAFVTVRRTGGTSGSNPDGSGNIQVSFRTSDETAVAGVNYIGVTNVLTFPSGEVLRTIAIPILDDYLVTPDLTVTLALGNPTAPAEIGDQPTAVLTIQNAGTALSFSSAAYSVLKNTPGGVAEITIVRQGGAAGTCSIDFATTTTGTATPGIDYTPTSGTVTFGPGELSKTIDVPVNNNDIPEGNTTVGLMLSNPSGAFLGEPSVATLTIVDTVVAPGKLGFAESSYTANEADSSVLITVKRTAGSSGNVSVQYSVVPGTATAGINYVNFSGSLTFADGQTTRTLSVPLIDNSLVQGPVSFSVVLSSPGGGAQLTTPTSTLVTINDNDTALAVVPAGSSLISESNANGMIDTNEAVTLMFALRVSGGTNISNLTATLLVTNGVVSPSPESQNFGSLLVNGPAASRAFSFNVDPAYTNGQQISATFLLQIGGSPAGLVEFPFVLGTATKVFSNANPIVINDGTMATPYPSTIAVSGVGNKLTKATVTLSRIKHSAPADIDVLLTSPAQRKGLIMANSGGTFAINNVTLTFDDAALGFLPQTGLINSGTYRSTSNALVTVFPAPAPGGPYATNLAAFNDSDPNGEWSLFVIDDSAFNTGVISNGWSIALTTTSPVGSAADIGVAVAPDSSSVILGQTFSYLVAATNYGPSASGDVYVTNTLPSGVSFNSASATRGSASDGNGVVIWKIGDLLLDQGALLNISVTAEMAGSQTNKAVVRSLTRDLNPADDSAASVLNVTVAQPPQIAASLTAGNEPFKLNISGAAVPTIIQSSTDLVNWIPVYTNIPPFIFTDANAMSSPVRFYRAVIAQ